jgi:hypothetical protein
VEAVSLFGRQTLTPRYWTESLQITDADIEYLFGVMLEREEPLDSRAMVRFFIDRRVRQETDTWRKLLAEGELFQPRAKYKVGQKLVFPALDFALGEVVGARAGASPEHGDFTVIEVAFDGAVRREFASELQARHALDMDEDAGEISASDLLDPVDISEIEARYGKRIRRELETRLDDEDDVVYGAGLWFLKSLLPTIDKGHVHLAEAVLDMNGGGPLAAEDILPILDLPAEVKPSLQAFALNYVLYNDPRFDEVGPAGLVRWYLRHLEPAEVRETPDRLLYREIPYDRSLLSDEALQLEAEIGDEFSPLPEPDTVPDDVTLTLIFPHRRAGTLPLNAKLSAMFPTAYEADRILVKLVDSETDEEYDGWVVRNARYVVGLQRFYRKYRLPIGVYVNIRRTDDPSRFLIDFEGYRPRTEWITLVTPQDGRISYQNHKRSIGAAYDDLMVLGAEDLTKVDELWQQTRDQRRSLVQTIRELLPELARLNPQSAVHVKTLYSAVNVVRRCPPGPILAVLESQSEFESVGGHYWRFNKDG